MGTVLLNILRLVDAPANKMVFLKSHTQTGYTGGETDDVTAKNSFLKNPELKAITFSHLQIEKLSCLLNAALTCKDFLEVALDILWEELDSMVPLLKVLPALQLEGDEYVCANGPLKCFFIRTYFSFSSLLGLCHRQIGIGCNITLEKSYFSSSLVKIIPGFILRLIFELVIFGRLLSSHLFVASTTV